MKVYLINPKFPVTFLGQEYACQVTGRRAACPPLSLLTVAALTPPGVAVELCDENTQPIRWDSDADLIGLTAMHLQCDRALEIARRFRRQGKRVVVGGPSVTAVPAWYRGDADVLIRGEAERLWPRFLRDAADGTPRPEYEETASVALTGCPPPRFDLIRPAAYAYVGLQTSRGCPFSCEFCDIIVLYGRTVRTKAPAQVLGELEGALSRGARIISFVDDNLFGNRAHAFALLEALRGYVKGLRRPPIFCCQASVNVAKEPALLRLMREAGVRAMFLGVETPRAASLAETQKHQNVCTDLQRDVETVQSHGILVTCGTVVGFDHDDAAVFDEQVDFLTAADITLIMPSQLIALPGTPLYARMAAAGRLRPVPPNRGERYVESNIRPSRMSNDELTAGYLGMLQRLYDPAAFGARLLGELERLGRAAAPPRPAFVPRPAVWVGLAWVLLWYLADAHRRALLRAFWRVVPATVCRHRPLADVALMRLIMYRHVYRLIDEWTRVFARERRADTAGVRVRVRAGQALAQPA